MKLITVRTQIRELPARLEANWRQRDGTWLQISRGAHDTEVIHAAVAAFATPEELARWMSEHQARDGNYEQWMKFITGPGWAPSLIMDAGGVRSGVQGV